MGFFDMFRRAPPIRSAAELADFIDGNAAFVTQKGLYEYSRARAGHYAKVLFADPGFHAAIEQSRWRAYPLGLLMVSEVTDSVFHSGGEKTRAETLQKLNVIVLSVFDRYPAPAALGAEAWRELRTELDRGLKLIAVRAPKRAMDIPIPFAQSYFDLMPIHEKLRGRDFATTRNYLSVTLCNVHHELSQRLDRAALAQVEAEAR